MYADPPLSAYLPPSKRNNRKVLRSCLLHLLYIEKLGLPVKWWNTWVGSCLGRLVRWII